MILFIVSDLIFRSRIREAITDPVFVKSSADAQEKLNQNDVKTVLLDLNLKNEDFVEIIKLLKSTYSNLQVICFGSHMNIEAIQQAKEAGADEVMANSAFVKWLELNRSNINQSGGSFLSLIVFALIFGSIGWYLFQVIPIYYRYSELENAMRSIAQVSQELDDKLLKSRLLTQMRDIGVPGNIEDVSISRTGSSIEIQYAYQEEVAFNHFGQYFKIQHFDFNLDIIQEPKA